MAGQETGSINSNAELVVVGDNAVVHVNRANDTGNNYNEVMMIDIRQIIYI